MLDSIVKLSEKISELLKYRAERRVRRFKNLIEPTLCAGIGTIAGRGLALGPCTL